MQPQRSHTIERSPGLRGAVAGGCAILLFWLTVLGSAPAAAKGPDARLFAAHALALREAGVAADDTATAILADVPGAARVSQKESPALWVPFFENAIVVMGRLPSDAPVALYYNPLLDVALLSFWKRSGDGYVVASVRALPGEVPAGSKVPPWTVSPQPPVTALSLQTAARLAAFRRAHPLESARGGRDAATFAAAARQGREALKRLYLNAVQRARWIDGSHPWLDPILVAVEGALATADAATLLRAAPETDAGTAESLVQLPPGFASGLTLDMALAAEPGGRLLIASRPEDGDIYLMALCRMEDAGEKTGTCALRRMVLLSLTE